MIGPVRAAVICSFVSVCAGASAAGAQDRSPTDPLRLRDAVSEALQRSPDLAPLDDAIVRAQLDQRRAEAPFGFRWTPALSGGSNPAGYSTRALGLTLTRRLATGTDVYVSGLSQSFALAGGAYRDSGYAVGFTQAIASLFTPVAKSALTAARRAVTSSERRRDQGRQQIILSVSDAYVTVVGAERLSGAADRALARARALHTASLKRSEAGLDTQLDVLRAELLVSQAEMTAGERLDALATAREQLNAAIGRPLDAPIVLEADILVPAIDDRATDRRDPLAVALASRADLQEQRAHVQDVRRRQTESRWNLLPPFNLNVEYSQRGLGSPFEALMRPYNGWHVGVTSTYQLDRTEQVTAAAVADLEVRAAERDAHTAEQRAIAEVRRAERAVTRADQATAIQRQAVDVAARQQRLARLRYERGLADNLAIVDAENAMMQAETASIAAELARRLARLQLRYAIGTLSVEDVDR